MDQDGSRSKGRPARGERAGQGSERMPDLWREVLIFETTYRLTPGRTKAQQILERFGFSAFTYRRLLKLALAHDEAAVVAPTAVKNKWSPNNDS